MAAAKARAAQESLAILLLRRSGRKQLICLTKASSTQNRPAQLDAIGLRLSNEAGDSGGKFFTAPSIGDIASAAFLSKSLSFVTWQD